MLSVRESKDEIDATKLIEDGTFHILVPRFIIQMTEPDRVEILKWHIKEGDIVEPGMPMVTVEFLQDDWYLPVPPLNVLLRVVSIKASVGRVVHLYDLLTILAPVQEVD